jgi:hypothetical protein
MKYFDVLPKIVYNNTFTNGSLVLTNLMARASLLPSLLNNPVIYYEYDIQEGDTPETIAFKYYNDVYRYWIILYANQIMDPQWTWPLTYSQFNAYIQDKYNYPYNDPNNPNTPVNYYVAIHEYQQITTQFDYNTQTTTVETISIDEDTYNTLPETQQNTYSLPSGLVKITVTKNAQTIYDYEQQQNEAKRNIKILNASYANEIESEFKKLMGKK